VDREDWKKIQFLKFREGKKQISEVVKMLLDEYEKGNNNG
jgi:hypothetical protein